RWWERDGVPFFMCGPGDPEDFLHRGTLAPDSTRSGDQDAIIAKLGSTDANCIWMTAIRSHGGDGDATQNPFLNHDPAQGLNPAVLDQWAGWIAALDAAGIVTFLTFYDDSARPWDTGDVVGEPERELFEALVERFEQVDLIVWNVAEEYDERYTTARISALATIIDAADGENHPISCHQRGGSAFDFADDPHLDSHALHMGDVVHTTSTLHEMTLDAWAFAAGRYHLNMSENRGQFDLGRDESRRLCWAAAMAGACVMVHRMDVAATPVEALDDCGRLRGFFESTQFHRMEPRDELARGETDFVFGDAAAGWIVYGESVAATLGLAVPAGGAGIFDLRWMDTENGTAVVEAGVSLAEGEHFWPKPTGLGAEVVLSVEPSGGPTSVLPSLETSSWGRVKDRYRTRSSTGGGEPR
ncbi:MAG: DUF4038 domain-containing protein, partial [bacterium]